jgi:hypothetical protein
VGGGKCFVKKDMVKNKGKDEEPTIKSMNKYVSISK